MIFYPSRIPDPGVKKAPDPDPQHCFFWTKESSGKLDLGGGISEKGCKCVNCVKPLIERDSEKEETGGCNRKEVREYIKNGREGIGR